MNKSMLFPIHKEWADKIFNGTKKFEFRNKLPKHLKSGMKIYFYETKGKVIGKLFAKNPTFHETKGTILKDVEIKKLHEGQGKVVGEAVVGKIINLKNAKYPQKVRLLTGLSSVTLIANGFAWHDFAIELTNVIKYENPIAKEEFVLWNKIFDNLGSGCGYLNIPCDGLCNRCVKTEYEIQSPPQAPLYVVERDVK